jgi:hypothetical protein
MHSPVAPLIGPALGAALLAHPVDAQEKGTADEAAIVQTRVLGSTTGHKVRHMKHGAPREGIFRRVVEKRGGTWLIVASQNTEVMPVLPGQEGVE